MHRLTDGLSRCFFPIQDESQLNVSRWFVGFWCIEATVSGGLITYASALIGLPLFVER